MAKRFDFGLNWRVYSQTILTPERLTHARDSLKLLVGLDDLSGRSFLDVGCGSGIFTLGAAQLGADPALGIDISTASVETSQKNREAFGIDPHQVQFQQMDVLDASRMVSLGTFQIVYAWGSLHHTGQMYRAIEITAQRVAPGGIFVLAIYNQHLTSPAWNWIKWLYNQVPTLVQRMMILSLGMVIALAKWLVTRQNPFQKERGMEFWVDVVDWVGGYPYEYATRQAIEEYVTGLGFILRDYYPAQVPTGCNEFVFVRLGI